MPSPLPDCVSCGFFADVEFALDGSNQGGDVLLVDLNGEVYISSGAGLTYQ